MSEKERDVWVGSHWVAYEFSEALVVFADRDDAMEWLEERRVETDKRTKIEADEDGAVFGVSEGYSVERCPFIEHTDP